MNEAVQDTDATPKLVVTMVWDAGGMNVLDECRTRIRTSTP